MGKEPEWKVDKQPAWLVAAIRRTIADLPHGYEEAAEILGLYKSDDITVRNSSRICNPRIFIQFRIITRIYCVRN